MDDFASACGMDYETELEMVRGHVAQGRRHLATQRRIVDDLNHRGADTRLAHSLLASFEQLQAMHLAHLNRLLDHTA
jgi:hypothetical protein